MTRPYCVGLTGGVGSGKSLAARYFALLGAEVIDTDLIARQLTGPSGVAMAAIVEAFGAAMRCPDDSLDRARMRDLVFSEPAARRRLEAILHPLILEAVERKLRAANGRYVVLVVPLLVESGAYGSLVERVLVVDCSEVQQVERAVARDRVTTALVRSIMASQASRSQRLAAADDIIDNQGSKADLQQQVEILHRKYEELASKSRA